MTDGLVKRLLRKERKRVRYGGPGDARESDWQEVLVNPDGLDAALAIERMQCFIGSRGLWNEYVDESRKDRPRQTRSQRTVALDALNIACQPSCKSIEHALTAQAAPWKEAK